MRSMYKLVLSVLVALGSAAAWAGYAFNFPEPVTPIAHETLHVHNLFMVVILILFFGVLV